MPADTIPHVQQGVRELNVPQRELASTGLVDSGFSTLLSMTTGSGKSHVALQAMRAASARGERAIYAAPLRAIAAEQATSWSASLPGIRVGAFHGAAAPDAPYQDHDLLVLTYERLDGLLRHWQQHPWLGSVGVVVIDEIHCLMDPSRGPRLEGTLSRVLRAMPLAQILGLSATMPNHAELARWLGGVSFHSSWRPVPLTHTVATFAKGSTKQDTVVDAVHAAARQGAVLVFAASRRRAESLAAALRAGGLAAEHHHAGLTARQREQIEARYRAGDIRVLVATPTLECGVNLPCRTVVIADDSRWTGEGWEPLPVWRYHQMAGRAGRPGQDGAGTAVLVAPKWVKRGSYGTATPEPIRSSLGSERALVEQVLIEVSARYCRTRAHLQHAFLPSTLFHLQHGSEVGQRFDRFVADLLGTGLLTETDGILRATPLGYLTVRHHLEPRTVTSLLAARFDLVTEFDLLLAVCCCAEVGPVLRLDVEDVPVVEEAIATVRSRTLDAPPADLPGRRLASGVLMALLLSERSQGRAGDDVAAACDVMAADLEMLVESAVRVLRGIADCLAHVEAQEDQGQARPVHASLAARCRQLACRVAGALPPDAARVLEIPGVGPALATTLRAAGFVDLETIALADPADLLALPGVGPTRAAAWPEAAAGLVNEDTLAADAPLPEPRRRTGMPTTWPASIEIGRFLRAMDLRVTGSGPWTVTGGADPHTVSADGNCDCLDAQRSPHGHRCKHLLARDLAGDVADVLACRATLANLPPLTTLAGNLQHLAMGGRVVIPSPSRSAA